MNVVSLPARGSEIYDICQANIERLRCPREQLQAFAISECFFAVLTLAIVVPASLCHSGAQDRAKSRRGSNFVSTPSILQHSRRIRLLKYVYR